MKQIYKYHYYNKILHLLRLHTHKQYSFIRKGVKYINPGSVGTPVDGSLGAQFTILDMTESSEVIEHYIILYNTDKLIEELKNSSIYNDDIKWGRIMEKELETGEDYPQKCIKEYKYKYKYEELNWLWKQFLKYSMSMNNIIIDSGNTRKSKKCMFVYRVLQFTDPFLWYSRYLNLKDKMIKE